MTALYSRYEKKEEIIQSDYYKLDCKSNICSYYRHFSYSLHQCQFCSCYHLQEHIKIEQIQVFIHTHEGKISTSQIYIETNKNYLLTLNQISILSFPLGLVTSLLSNGSSLGWISLRQPKVIIVLFFFHLSARQPSSKGHISSSSVLIMG